MNTTASIAPYLKQLRAPFRPDDVEVSKGNIDFIVKMKTWIEEKL